MFKELPCAVTNECTASAELKLPITTTSSSMISYVAIFMTFRTNPYHARSDGFNACLILKETEFAYVRLIRLRIFLLIISNKMFDIF